MDHPWPILFIIVAGFAMLDVAFCYQHYINRVCERDPSATGPACEFGWTSGWEAYCWIVNSPRSALCGGLGVCPEPKRCYEKINDDRATYKEGVQATYRCAEGPPGSKWNLAGGGSTAVAARNPPRASAKQLRRAYDRAREELRTLEREARPKDIK